MDNATMSSSKQAKIFEKSKNWRWNVNKYIRRDL